jgi:asparagine synthase (glutamine-hydrolysing)
VLSDSARRELAGYSTRDAYRRRFAAVEHLDPLQQVLAVDLETYLPGDILVKADRATMAFSLEGRSPWMDYRIGEIAFRLPSSYKLHGSIGKYIFKKALADLLPDPILTRSKMGFSVPLAQWFRSSLKPTFESQVLRPEMEPFLNLKEVRRIWAEHQSGLVNHEMKLWNLLTLSCWESRHLSRIPVEFAADAAR